MALGTWSGCAAPECANPDYRDPECRALAENEVARLHSGRGTVVRFVDPDADADDDGWVAAGVVEQVAPGEVAARVAGLGRFAVAVDGAGPLTLTLHNVDPDATVRVHGPGEAIVDVPPGPGLVRRISLALPEAGGSVRVRGEHACPARFRLAVVGDVQNNPQQFARILERLAAEQPAAAAAGEPLLGALVLGDLTESSTTEEFVRIREILDRSPVPVAVTVGNHDIYASGAAQYNQAFGPGTYAFTLCGARVVLLDTASGMLAASLEARLPEVLDRGDAGHLLVGTHYPPYSGLTADGWAREDQAHRLMVEAAIQGADLLLTGHVHALIDHPSLPVGDRRLHEIIVGTGGASQGAGVPRYGYLRLAVGAEISDCFVEVPPPGAAGPLWGGVVGLPVCAGP